jgi:protein-S-isoprenylcysteine O-methyltransferase Ste14
MAKNKRSRFSTILKSIIIIVVFLAILFIPAGRLNWLEGWLFFCAYMISMSALVFWGYRTNPELMRERAEPGENVKTWDRIILGIYTVLLIVMLVLAGLDSGRYNWSSPPLFVYVLGWLGLLFSLILIWWTFASNPYLSEQVRIQDDRGHEVVSDGPYRYVRHPMYVGIIVTVLCVPLVLGSFLALIPAVLIVVLFVIRTALEDRTLQEELEGYRAYARRVKSRLVPYIW